MNHDSINTALMLLAIGMTTVFIVLLLVVLTGNILIRFVNRFSTDSSSSDDDHVNPKKIAAITAAVEVALEGKGHITSIRRA